MKKKTQATRIIEKFGGYDALAAHLGRHPITVRRWEYAIENGGSGGVLPPAALREVLAAADVLGIELTTADLDPRPW